MLELVQKGVKTVINVFHMLEKWSKGREDIKDPTCSQLLNKLIPGLGGRNQGNQRQVVCGRDFEWRGNQGLKPEQRFSS